MPADTVTVGPDQPKWLCRDPAHVRCEVGKHYPSQFKTALIHHEVAIGR
jgi:hypothetical protein